MEMIELEFIHPYNFSTKPEEFDSVLTEMIKLSTILKQS